MNEMTKITTELVLSAQAGNQAAVRALFIAIRPAVKHACYRFFGSDREGVMQAGMEGALRALKKWKKNGGQSFVSYAFVWAEAFARREHHKRSKFNSKFLSGSFVGDDGEESEWTPSDEGLGAEEIEHRISERQNAEHVAAALLKIPTWARELIQHRASGATLEQAGAAMSLGGISREGARKRQILAVKMLRAKVLKTQLEDT
jgi:RNA polymerase sigma factor (sigma-70 family)